MTLPFIPENKAIVCLRVAMGLIFISHGAARVFYGSIGDFGTFLNGQGLVIGDILAWTITIGEMLSGLLMVLGILVPYSVIFHFVIIAVGIFMVHLNHGWFVVGHGQGGVEYSLLILMVLLFLYGKYNKPN